MRNSRVPSELHTEQLCSESFLRAVEGCPVYTEFFKEGDAVPASLCARHQGSFKQRAARAVGGFLYSLGSKITGIFRR